MARRTSDTTGYQHRSSLYQPPNSSSTQPKPNVGAPHTHSSGGRTNAGASFSSSGPTSQRRHSDHLGGGVGVGTRDGEGPRSHSPGSTTGSSGTTNSWSLVGDTNRAGKPPVAALSVSSIGGGGRCRPATGPVKGAHSVQVMRERSQSVESVEGSESAIDISDGKKGRMREVEDGTVLISFGSASQARSSSNLGRPPLSSITRRDGVPSTSGIGLTSHQEPLLRQGSGGSSYHSGEMRSGEGVYGQPHSSGFSAGNPGQSKAKALTGEGSIDITAYTRAISKSGSESSFEGLPRSKRTSESCSDNLADLRDAHDESITKLTERLSIVEGEKEKLKKDNEKLERKFNEAKEVAEQADLAAMEVSRLEAALKKERDEKERLLRGRSASPEEDKSLSMKLNEELSSLRTQLDHEMSARAAVEQEMSSLKQSLVVGGQRDTVIVRRQRDRVAELEGTIDNLQQTVAEREGTLAKKEAETKRQNQVHSHTIADLQGKLSRARGEREELRQSVGSGSRAPGPTSPDATAMARQLREKEETIQKCHQQLQERDASIQKYVNQFEKTAREVAKITQHSKQQSQRVATLKVELDQAEEALDKREGELEASRDELTRLRTTYDNIIRTKNAELAKKTQEMEQLKGEMGDLRREMAQLVEGEARRSELEQTLQKSQSQLNHWKQKSVQQDMVLQTNTQGLERVRRENEGLKTTVSAQGKEVERLQRENETLRGDIETHKLTAVTYREDFESERKDREAVHTKIADMETQYRHQLEAMGKQLQRVTDDANRQKESVADRDHLLQQQRQQLTAELHQKEGELASASQRITTLEEEVMSKTQQVKQYKKQIDQLVSEVTTLREQAKAHMEQIEFYAKKTEEYGRQRTFKEIHERKIATLEAQCDKLLSENNELRSKMDALKLQPPGGALQSRTPAPAKSHTLGGGPTRAADAGLPSKIHGVGHQGSSRSPEPQRAGHPSNYQPHLPHSNHNAAPPRNHQQHATPPYSNAGPTVPRQGHMGGQPSHYPPQYRQDSLYSSLPGSGLGYAPPAPAGDVVDKDSPPNSNIGQGAQPPPGQQRRAHSQMLSMATAGNSGRFPPHPPPPAQSRPPPPQGYGQHGHQQPPNIYSNLPLYNTSGVGGSGALGRQYVSQRYPERQPAQPPAVMRQPHTQDVSIARIANQHPPQQLSTPTEETHRRRFQKPPLEGYVQPQQASSHPVAGQRQAVQPLMGGGTAGKTHRSTVNPSGDISKGIDSVIEETVSRVREDEQVAEGDGGEGIPYDPNLVCPNCRMKFREGEIQKFRRHVSSAHK